MKLAVCTPWASPFMFSGYVDAQLNLERPAGWDVRFFRGLGWCPARRHLDMCEKAVAWGADVLCITGADQVHPEDTLVRLLARMDEGYDVVAALVPARGYIDMQKMVPFERMAWRIKSSGSVTIEGANALLGALQEVEPIDPDSAVMQEIHFIGSGTIMFPRDVLLALKAPWFSETYNAETLQRRASMDTIWVWRLQTEGGARVWVDTSIKVKHLHIFSIDESFPARFADWAQPGIGDPAVCVFPQESAL